MFLSFFGIAVLPEGDVEMRGNRRVRSITGQNIFHPLTLR